MYRDLFLLLFSRLCALRFLALAVFVYIWLLRPVLRATFADVAWGGLRGVACFCQTIQPYSFADGLSGRSLRIP